MKDRDSAVDWEAAVRSAQRVVAKGPEITAEQAAAAVDDLRAYSGRAELAVRDVTGLGAGLPVAEADVVDRPRWIAATADGMARLSAPLTERLVEKTSKVGRAVAGRQIGVVLGFLASRVLGQYDPLSGDDGQGRLYLVAPNIIKVERELDADPADFRMWVCLHESTHRLQFTAVPWLRDYFTGQVDAFGAAADVDASEILSRMVQAIRGGRGPGASWIETLQSPAQREVFDRLMGLMSLLEGHADHVMDAVGPQVVPTVAEIRAGFSKRRRTGRGPIDRILRSLLGMDMKMSQYIKGEAFVSQVVSRVGMDGFNTIWTSPEALPSRVEIDDPHTWVARVLG